MPGRVLLVAAAALAVGAAVPGRTESAESNHLKIIVGLTDDTGKWMRRPDGLVGVYHDLRLMAVRITVPWRPGQTRPTRLQQTYLHRIAGVMQLRTRVVLAVYNRAEFAPADARSRAQYCGFLGHVAARISLLNDVEIWNEANSPTFWPQRDGARSYEALLARCWDVLHGVRDTVNVIGSTAPHHDPARFILGLGEAYRDSGRELPIFDTFGHNPYPEDSAEPPSTMHDDTTTLGEGDYATLVRVLEEAFTGTGQPVPGPDRRTIWYLEDGFQTIPPPDKHRFYRGRESDPHPLPAVAAQPADGDPLVDQATQLHDAIVLAYCQPAVSGFFNFELLDEDRLEGWQSGLLWRDGTRKPSYDTFKAAIAEMRRRDTDCSKVPGAPRAG
jgi:hypothetical protein